jgi:hypothetical protein
MRSNWLTPIAVVGFVLWYSLSAMGGSGLPLASSDSEEQAVTISDQTSPSMNQPAQWDDEPGIFERMSAGTRAFFDRARRAMGWGQSNKRPTQVSQKRSATNRFGLGSLFKPSKPDGPRTVDEWLELERPKAF